MTTHFVEAVIVTGEDATVDGRRIDSGGTPDPYTAIYRHVAALARERGEPILVRGVDRTQGIQVAWFTVDATGRARATEAPAGSDSTGRARATEGSDITGRARATEGSDSPDVPDPPDVPDSPDAPVDSDSRVAMTPTHAEHAATGPRYAAASAPPSPTAATPADPQRPLPTAAAPADPQRPLPDRGAPDSVIFVRPPRSTASLGFRGALNRLSGGLLHLGPGARQLSIEGRDERIARQLERPYSTAFLSFKGGIGKTSTTAGVGLVMAEVRGAPPCAIDANPDSGDLAERLLGQNILGRMDAASISDLVRNLSSIRSLTDLQRYVLQKGRFHFVAGEQDPAVSDSLTAEDYARVHDLLQQYYGVILTDCGTGVTHTAMRGILDRADNVVVAAGYAVSGAERAASTLTWLAAHGYPHLAGEALVVLTDKDDVSQRVQKDVIRDHLAALCRGVFVVPADPSVADGDRISLANARPRTREAYAEVAAAIVDGYR